MGAYSGTLRGNARFDLRDPALAAYAVNTRVESVSADELLSAWTPAKGLPPGQPEHEPRSRRRRAHPAGSPAHAHRRRRRRRAGRHVRAHPALAAIAEGGEDPRASSRSNSTISGCPFRVEQGRVITNGARSSGRAGDWAANGSVGLDGTLDYAVSITLAARRGGPARRPLVARRGGARRTSRAAC